MKFEVYVKEKLVGTCDKTNQEILVKNLVHAGHEVADIRVVMLYYVVYMPYNEENV